MKKPRDYQKNAIDAVIAGFKSADRGQLILPCGAGKTMVAMWIAQKMNAKRILVLVPSLSLLKQIKDEWIAAGLDLPRMCVCSQADIDTDSIAYSESEIDSNVTTDPFIISHFLNNNDEHIIYSTYHSSDCLSAGILKARGEFDLIICDEAHKTAGVKMKNSAFITVHDNKKIPAKKRLYMTATPRILKIGSERSNDCFCMDNSTIFGTEFFNMSFKEAIDKNILVDYQIVAIGVSSPEIKLELDKRSMLSNEDNILQMAHNYALEKFMRQYDAKHAITFHSSVIKAKNFAKNHIELLGVNTYHVNGKQTATQRRALMDSFEQSDYAVMTNARCLTEGIDIPSIDVVYFCDPKNSKIDVIQAAGRALRRSSNGKKVGYIVVPLFHSAGSDVEKTVDASLFSNLMSIIRAIGSQDGRLADGFKYNKKSGYSGHIKFGGTNFVVAEDKDAKNDPLLGDIKESLYSELLRKFKTVSSEEFLAVKKRIKKHKIYSQRRYKELKKLGYLEDLPWDPSTYYKHSGWVSWGDFLGNNNVATQDVVFLPYEEAKALIQSKGIINSRDYRTKVELGELPGLPTTPNKTYKDQWSHWGEFLGTGDKKRILASNPPPYEELKKAVRELGVTSKRDYKYKRDNYKLPIGAPSKPERYKEWTSWGDFLMNDDIQKIEPEPKPEPIKKIEPPATLKTKGKEIKLVVRKQRPITQSLEERAKLFEEKFNKVKDIA